MPKRKRSYRYAPRKKSTAVKALRLARSVKRRLAGEQKYAMTSTIANNPGTSGSLVGSLMALAQGDNVGEREGFQVKMKSVYVKYSVYAHPSSSYTVLRLVLVQDKQQVADQSPTWLDVFDSNEVTSMRNYLTKGRFSILGDRTITIPNGGQSIKAGSIYKPLSTVVRYNGATGSDIQKGGIYLFCISNEPTNTPYLRWQATSSYFDN